MFCHDEVLVHAKQNFAVRLFRAVNNRKPDHELHPV